ncbi:MAG: hydrogenase maturation nickel metallochaperone HypA [Candidatus Omnitrophica bacterium]|nr:hydrogenase maturation nickel metallochaperone HypA [Candidatus Omnitrophota bacterium]MDD5662565.1 hydrogenase maturation nickel metallochaperone HypA [Candidatus Omnitrophota bacterium]
MHDMWFAGKIIVLLKEKIKKSKDYKDIRVNVILGPFTHVTPESLRSAFMLLSEKEGLGNVGLNIQKNKAKIKCRKCKKSVEISAPVAGCPLCGADDFDISDAEEFSVQSIEITQG